MRSALANFATAHVQDPETAGKNVKVTRSKCPDANVGGVENGIHEVKKFLTLLFKNS